MTALRWALAMAAFAVAFWPLTFAFFRVMVNESEEKVLVLSLGFALPVGLSILGYLAWLGMLAHVSLFDARVLWGLVALVALASWGRWGRATARAARSHSRLVLFTSLTGLVLTALWWIIRVAGNEEFIFLGEHIMNIAFAQMVIKYPQAPPPNPFLAGFNVDFYYYFFSIFTALVAVLSRVPLPISYFYLGIAWPAIVGMGVFAVLYTLARRVLTPWIGVFTYLFVSNWGIFLQFPAEAGWLPKRLLSPYALISTLKTTGSIHFPPMSPLWWVFPTRIMPDENPLPYAITEFPFFSYAIGDLHPHIIVAPWTLLGLYLATRSPLKGWRQLLGLAFFLGIVPPIHSWSVIPMLMLLGWRVISSDQVWRTAARVGTVLILAFLFFLPYHLNLQSPILGYRIRIFPTPLTSWMLHWGPLLLPILVGLMALLSPRWRVRFLAALALALVIGYLGNFIVLAALIVILAAIVLLLLRGPAPEPLLWLAVWGAVNVLTEVFYLEDFFGGRYNTVFKVYFDGWMLATLAAVLLLERVSRRGRAVALAWIGTGLVYTVAVVAMIWPNLPTATRGVDPRWLPDNLYPEHRLPVVKQLEKSGRVTTVLEAKTAYPVASVMAGLIEVAQRDVVLLQWYAKRMDKVGKNLQARDRFFLTQEDKERTEILRKFKVNAIIVGNEERWLYGYDLDFRLARVASPGLSSGSVIAYHPQTPRLCFSLNASQSFEGDAGALDLIGLRVTRGVDFEDRPVVGVFEVWEPREGDLAQMSVFVHVLNARGQVAAQVDHSLGLWDTRWQDPKSGRVYAVHWAQIPVNTPISALRFGVWIPNAGKKFRPTNSPWATDEAILLPLDGC